MTVGGSWLNKIGVLVFVIGLALLIGYSMTHVGPAGRIAIGFAVSLGMLATGVVLERRDDYRTYAYGLIAGGWAGTYFTTYAMRAAEAARVIDSDLLAIVTHQSAGASPGAGTMPATNTSTAAEHRSATKGAVKPPNDCPTTTRSPRSSASPRASITVAA